MSKTIVVVGGGASGLTAAITAARTGAKVTILEQNSKLGKKVLSTGNGRCNLTNLDQSPEFYRSETPEFVQQVLRSFHMEKTLEFFRELGIITKNRNGYLYPRSNQASTVVEALEAEARALKIKSKTREEVISIEKLESGFSVHTKTWHYECDCVILACGSKASIIEGSNGSGYILAKELGHSLITPLPALVGLKGRCRWFSKWAGVRTDAKVTLWVNDRICASDTGEVQLTDYGISGIPVFQVSRFASRAWHKRQTVKLELDFLPEMEEKEISAFLEERMHRREGKSIRELLFGLFPSKLIDVLCDENDREITEWVHRIKHFQVPVESTMDYDHAQVCTGGVSCEEIDVHTMESKLVPGIYFCGELLDADGACGGYNLQWAWSSGYLAGISASK